MNGSTVPSSSLNEPFQSHCPLLFICGDQSGVGKSSVSLGLLGTLLSMGYPAASLAYIKPVTQCEDIQLVWKFCHNKGITYRGIGPVIFYEGFTAECIEGKDAGAPKRLESIRKAVHTISEGKSLVIVDGVGYPAVGSVAGCSNADVAATLGAPVMIVGRPGVGNAIDSIHFILSFFHHQSVHVLGAVWNRIPPKVTYHTYQQCHDYVNQYFNTRLPTFGTYGHIPLIVQQKTETCPLAPEGSCRIRATDADLVMDEYEQEKSELLVCHVSQYMSVSTLLRDLYGYYKQSIPTYVKLSLPITTSSTNSSTTTTSLMTNTSTHPESTNAAATTTSLMTNTTTTPQSTTS